MKDSYFNAKLIAPDLIRIMCFSISSNDDIKPTLLINNKDGFKLELVNKSSANNLSLSDYRLPNDLQLGNSYKIQSHLFGIIPLDITDATSFPGFDDTYFYDGDDLGANVKGNNTEFVLWAPLASKVVLKIRKETETCYQYFDLKREEKGIYRLSVKKNLEGYRYLYLITNNEIEIETVDPYSKSVTLNSKESIVFDPLSFKDNNDDSNLKPQLSYSQAIIYETHIRDFTSSSNTNIVNKGQFAGFIEEDRISNDGNRAGFDYLKDLGITHLQLLPLMDYRTVDEENPSASYNWGYDPYLYFVPEGSLSNRSDDSRINDLKLLISKCHNAGIRIILDVVFNHIYLYEDSVLEKVVPNYFFRKQPNGVLSNCSWCGNDLASEKPMVKKLILDASKFWIDFYHVDGFRFDLMGILDCDLLNEIKAYGDSKRPCFMTYGEGWNMGSLIPNPGTSENHELLHNFAFFNDFYRENLKSLASGKNISSKTVFEIFTGSTLNGKFATSNESVNYVECHDNRTLFDYLSLQGKNEEEILRIIRAVNTFTIFSLGIPFIHMGQEIGLTKYGEDNTYNKPDKYNQFKYEYLKERGDLFCVLKEAIKIRKNNNIFDLSNIHDIERSCSYKEIDNATIIKINNYLIGVNFTDSDISYNNSRNVDVLFDSSNSLHDSNIYLPKYSVTLFQLK